MPTHAPSFFRRRQRRGQHHAITVNARRIVHVVEFKRMRGRAVGERGGRWRIATLPEQPGSRSIGFPPGKPTIELRDPGGISGAGNNTEGIAGTASLSGSLVPAGPGNATR